MLHVDTLTGLGELSTARSDRVGSLGHHRRMSKVIDRIMAVPIDSCAHHMVQPSSDHDHCRQRQ